VQALTCSPPWAGAAWQGGIRGPSEYELNSVAVVNVKAERAA